MLWVILGGLCHFSVTLPRPFHPVLGGILLYGDSTTRHPRALTACWVPCRGNKEHSCPGGMVSSGDTATCHPQDCTDFHFPATHESLVCGNSGCFWVCMSGMSLNFQVGGLRELTCESEIQRWVQGWASRCGGSLKG